MLLMPSYRFMQRCVGVLAYWRNAGVLSAGGAVNLQDTVLG